MVEQRFVFDDIARTYARVRPVYPSGLIGDLIEGAALQPGARLLEIGSGPGTATAPFVEAGYELVCVEPGQQMGALARQRFAGQPVEVQTCTFEDWELTRGAFDLVFAAQCFHWVDPAVRCVKAHAALKPGGSLAIFANRPEHGRTPLDEAIRATYARVAPQLTGGGVMTNTVENFRRIFDDSGLFDEPNAREYHWTQSYPTDDYLALLSTHSNHRMLEPDRRGALFAAVAEAIERHGGSYQVPYVAVLCFARRRE